MIGHKLPGEAETVEQERTRYRREAERLRKHFKAEIDFRRSLGEKDRSMVHLNMAEDLEARLRDVDAQA